MAMSRSRAPANRNAPARSIGTRAWPGINCIPSVASPLGREVSASRGVVDGAETADCAGRERREEVLSGNGSGRVASPGCGVRAGVLASPRRGNTGAAASRFVTCASAWPAPMSIRMQTTMAWRMGVKPVVLGILQGIRGPSVVVAGPSRHPMPRKRSTSQTWPSSPSSSEMTGPILQ